MKLQNLSLRLRLNIIFGGLLALGLLADIAVTVMSAGGRIEPEIQNTMSLVDGIIRGALRGMHESPGLDAALDDLAHGLDKLRHVSVAFRTETGDVGHSRQSANSDKRHPPQWFVELIHPGTKQEKIDAVVNGKSRGAFVVTADPDDEISEIWDSVADLAVDGSIAAALGFVLLFVVVQSGLRPLGSLSRALTSLREGNYAAQLSDDGPTEFRGLVNGFNDLSASLRNAQVENQVLRARLVSIQDDERRELARELHDEVGPHLFAARAHADAARRIAASGQVLSPQAIMPILESMDAIQEINRRILHWLRPAALAELGLTEALFSLKRFWERSMPEVDISISVDDDLPKLGERFDTALYRIAQESVTNAIRHSGATAIVVNLGATDTSRIVLSISDNGAGPSDFDRDASGLGVLGIRERVAAFGGSVEFRPAAPVGLVVRAEFPTVPSVRSHV